MSSQRKNLQKQLEENNLTDTVEKDTQNELEVKTLQLEKTSQHQTRGAIIRSKASIFSPSLYQ